MTLKIFTDGGARGNPGPAASGVFIVSEDTQFTHGFGKTLGTTTNNVAEYTAVILAYDWLIENKTQFKDLSKIKFFMDSNLIYSQLTGKFKVLNPGMKRLYSLVKEREKVLNLPVSYSYIPRIMNKEADGYVNLALDNLL